jgi:hypothetical protein
MHCHDYQHWQADRNDEEAAGISATTVERLKPKLNACHNIQQ